MHPSRRIYLVFLVLVVAWCSLILAAPLLQSFSGTKPPAAVLYRFFARICHQLDDRSFHLNGERWAVCIRCSAIYFAFLAGLLSYPWMRTLQAGKTPSLHWLLAASVPMAFDVGLSLVGIHASTAVTRLLTGSLLGVALPFYILPPLVDALTKLSHSSSTPKGELLYARKTK